MRTLITIVIAALSLNAFGQVPNYVPSDGLVAWYPFNGNANDESGVSANGEVFSAELTADRFGTPDEAYYFSGVGCSPHIETDIDFQGSTEGMTISFWLNRQGSGCSYPRLFGFWSGGNNPQSWGMAWGNSANLDYVQESPPNEEWHHIVVTLTSESIHSYLNGSFNGAYGSTKQPPLASYMAIGRMTHPAYDAFNGFMDDIGIWNRALTETEIQALYTAEIPISGCTDETACNFDQDANVDDGSCIPSGCMDTYACNFNSEAECEGEACDYTCCPGPGCCSEGLYWDWALQECFITNSTDSNLDGCTDLNDLMDILANYGDCAVAESEFICGDPLGYQGYDYETVLIGEQCWFAENLQAEDYRNGDGIQLVSGDDDWTQVESGAQSTFIGERFYNGFAAIDERGICPQGWSNGTKDDWAVLIATTGGESAAGEALKAVDGWDGNNSSGFSGLPIGYRTYWKGAFFYQGEKAFFWTNTLTGEALYDVRLLDGQDDVLGGLNGTLQDGFSVRCIKD